MLDCVMADKLMSSAQVAKKLNIPMGSMNLRAAQAGAFGIYKIVHGRSVRMYSPAEFRKIKVIVGAERSIDRWAKGGGK